ncbi:hypothetical protein FG386_000536 [Cryptosporidium ryanae]|uniref:uncharacterized protein n=1 Tax=Cryptosporidium ryanae TaxID=515981 RepID=UPI00351AA883|nr:hypothetical protein FG386_000536 [Cryptosporidium ryanae]
MELLVSNQNNEKKEKAITNYPDLRCSVYLAYPEFDEYVEDESDVQLMFCIRELYDYVYNKNQYIELSKKLIINKSVEVADNNGELGDNLKSYSVIDKFVEHNTNQVNNTANCNENGKYYDDIGDCINDFLNFVSNISSIISVCLETKLDRNQSANVYNKQIQRLREQERNIKRIRDYAIDNYLLLNLVEKVSNSIQYKLYCLVKICNDYSINITDDREIDREFNLIPLRIKYPYLTGTYIQVEEREFYGDTREECLSRDSKIYYKNPLEANVYTNNKELARLNNNINDEGYNEDIQKLISRIELNARSKIKGNRNKIKPETHGESIPHDENSNQIVGDQKFKGIELPKCDKYERKLDTNCEVIMDKLVGGATRIINQKTGKDVTRMKVNGWGLIRHNLNKNHIEDTSKSVRNNTRDCLCKRDERGENDEGDIVVIDRRKNKKEGNSKKLLILNENNVRCKKNQNSSRVCLIKNNEKSEQTCNCECKCECMGNCSSNNVRKIKSIFEKESPRRDVELYNSESDYSDRSTLNNEKKINTNNRKYKDSYLKQRKKVSSRVGSPSHVPLQSTNGITTGTSTRQQLSNYKETMYSTSSWLPLSRNTGFNLEYLNSNIKMNEKQQGTEYNPAAEYARFSDAVGKVIHPIVADESYRNNGKNILNPKKLFNAKFGTLTVDNFREIQEQLRLKTEGWTIHGSGLQDPRANLFWDPAVMTAASTASPFYTNMASSNSPLLINTLIPSNSPVSRRTTYNQEFSLDSPSSSYSSFSDKLGVDQDYKTDSQYYGGSEYYKVKNTNNMNSRIVSGTDSFVRNPISSMRDLSRKRKNN